MNTIEPQNHVFTAVCVNGKIVDTLKPIKVDDYWVIVEEVNTISKGSWVEEKGMIYQLSDYGHSGFHVWNKIITSTKFIDKSIPVIKFVKYTVEELAANHVEKNKNNFETWKEKEHTRIGFIAGYNQSSEKKYTEEDILKSIIMSRKVCSIDSNMDIDNDNLQSNLEGFSLKYTEKNIIQSLNQPKLPDVINLEMEEVPFVKVSWETDEMFEERKKNGDKILKLKTTSTKEGEIIEIKI